MSSLNDTELEEIKNLYNSFKDELKTNIRNGREISKVQCYLIKKKWDIDFNDNLKNNKPVKKFYRKYSKYQSQSNEPFHLPDNSPEFINNIKTVIDCLKNDEELMLESYDLIEKTPKKDRIRVTKSYLNYWAGSSKIILEYGRDNEILLIENALGIVDGISKNKKIINIKFNSYLNEEEKEEIFNYLLSRSYKYINLEKYKIQKIIEDILKEEVKEETQSSFYRGKPAETSRIQRGYQRGKYFQQKVEIKEETKQEKKFEKELETPKGEEKKENINTQGYRRFHRYIQPQKEIEKPIKEEDTTKQLNYNDKQSESTIESQNTRPWKRGRQMKTENKYNIIEQKNENNYTKKHSIYSQNKDGESIELKKEIENLKIENQTLIRNNDELSKQNSKLNNDINSLNMNLINIEKEKNSLNRTINEKDKDIKNMNKDYERLKNELDDLKENLNNETKIKKQREKEFQQKISIINNLEKEKKQLLKKDDDLEKKFDDISKKYEQKYKENDKLFNENQKLKASQEENNKIIKDLQKKIQDNEKDYKSQTLKLDEYISKIEKELDDKIKYNEELIQENKDLSKNGDMYKKQIKDYESNEKKYLSQIKNLENNNKSQTKENQNKINNLEKEKKDLEKKIKDLEINYSKLQKKYDDEYKQNNSLYEENEKLKNNEIEFNKTINELENTIKLNEKKFNEKLLKLEKEKKEEIIKIQNELNENINNNKVIMIELVKLKEKEKSDLMQIKDLEMKERNYQKEIKDFQNQINALIKELNDVKGNNTLMTLDNDKFFKENEMLRKNEQNLINQINNLNMQLKVKKDNNDKEMQQKIKEINEQKWFLENQQIAIQTEKQKLDKQRQELDILSQQLQMEKKKIANNQANQPQFNNNNNNNMNSNININNSNINNMNRNMNLKRMNNVPNNISMNNVPMNITPPMNNMPMNNTPMNMMMNTPQMPLNNGMMFNNMNNMNSMNNMNCNFNNRNNNNIINCTPFGNNMPNNTPLMNNNIFMNIIPKTDHIRIPLPKKDGKPISTYKKPTLIGLNNIGATCYLNSTLQCLSQTKVLTDYFLLEKNRNKIINNNIALKNRNELQLCPIYLDLIENLWKKNASNKSFSPNQFMNTIEAMNPLFKKGQAGDSKDFIIFILEQIHKELKKPVKNNKEPNEALNQYDKGNAFKHFMFEFQNEVSIISDMFFGFNETTNICLFCKNSYQQKNMQNPICYNYGIFNVLIFPLEEVKNMKINYYKANNVNINNINEVNLYECFYYNQKTDLFTGENKNYCNICRQLWDSEYTSYIFSSPNILVMILNRGKNNIYKVKINFSEIIDISQFVMDKSISQTYNLYGVITHLGESGPNAHFVASCKSPVDGVWYRYNDAIVNPIDNFEKDILNFGNPYILFYQKNN